MSEFEERIIAGLTVRIDRSLCVGFGDCIDEASDAFAFDEQGIVTFTAGAGTVPRERLIAACETCPVDALAVFEDGAQITPQGTQ